MKRFIPPSVPFTEKWSIEMKKVLSVVSLIMGIVPFSLLFIWKQELNKIAARWPAKAVTQFFFS